MPGVRAGGRTEARRRRRAARRHTMAALASAVVAAAAATGVIAAGADDGGRTTALPDTTASPVLEPLPAVPTPTASPSASATAAPSPSPSRTPRRSPAPSPSPKRSSAPAVSAGLYRHPRSQVLDWVGAHRDDPRRPLIESRIAAQPAAVWFPAHNPGAVTGQVRGVTSAAAAAGRTPVLVPYAIPDRDCGGASEEVRRAWTRTTGGSPTSPRGSAAGRSSSSWNRTRSPCRTASPPHSGMRASRPWPAPAVPCTPRTHGPGSTSTADTPAGTAPPSRPRRSARRAPRPAATASSPTCPTSTARPTRPRTPGGCSRRSAGSPAWAPSSTPAATATGHRRRGVVRPGGPGARQGPDDGHRPDRHRRVPLGEAAGRVRRLQGIGRLVHPGLRLRAGHRLSPRPPPTRGLTRGAGTSAPRAPPARRGGSRRAEDRRSRSVRPGRRSAGSPGGRSHPRP